MHSAPHQAQQTLDSGGGPVIWQVEGDNILGVVPKGQVPNLQHQAVAAIGNPCEAGGDLPQLLECCVVFKTFNKSTS